MDVCHILLGRPWQYDKNVRHDGKRNTYELEKDRVKHKLIPLQAKDKAGSSKTLLLGEKEFLQQLAREEVSYDIVCKLSDSVGMELSSLPVELQNMLKNFEDIIVGDFPSELPPVRKISHHMDFIPGMSLPNKAA